MSYLKDYLDLGKTCTRCGQTYSKEKQHMYFYSSHNNTIKLNVCKQCIQDLLDVNNIPEVLLVLKALDIPFVKREWNGLINRYGKNSNIIGRYIAKMNLRGYRDFTYEDSKIFKDNDPPGQPC